MFSKCSFIALLVTLVYVLASDLRDKPLVGDGIQYLDGDSWTARASSGLEIGATVPGDLITDLQRGSVIADPLYELTWMNNSSIWDRQDWVYERIFLIDDFSWIKDPTVLEIYLVFDGVKMAADLSLNGKPLGVALDQFLRYIFPVKSILLPSGDNTVKVSFASQDPRIDPEVRFMPCAGGWDWAPYSSATGVTPGGVRTFTKGIWKSVYLLAVRSVAIAHVVPLVFYNGEYPTTPLLDPPQSSFTVTVRVHFLAPASATGVLSVAGEWDTTQIAQAALHVPQGESNFTLTLTASPGAVKLWWPNGMGAQPLYHVHVNFTPQTDAISLNASRQIGFRVFALVTDDDTQPARLQSLDGSGALTFRYRVNGANVYARGANFIPMDELDGRANARALYWALRSAADARMNTIRIWGGGIWQYEAFYETADKLGLMLYHDLMYSDQADSFHMAAPTAMQAAELSHQIRRLAHHPSVVIWDGCNECGGAGALVNFLMPLLAVEDPSRALWPSCPSAGWASGVDRLWSRPNSSPAGLRIKTLDVQVNETSEGVCQQGGNYHGFPVTEFLVPVPTPSAAACMQLCANTTDCLCGMYSSGGCQLKGFEWMVPTWGGPNLWACFPGASAASLPAMPATWNVEQHGPYQVMVFFCLFFVVVVLVGFLTLCFAFEWIVFFPCHFFFYPFFFSLLLTIILPPRKKGGGGWPTVNGVNGAPFDSDIPSHLLPTTYAFGPSAPGVFVSEFGSGTMSSFESLR